ncbi:hypothetical protein [Paenibacillus sp. NPDC055715]
MKAELLNTKILGTTMVNNVNNYNEKKIVGVFDTEQEASRAIGPLTGTKAPEGVATGAATGGVVGGGAGLLVGIGAFAIPGIGPILAAGPIAATLTGAAVGAGAGGLVGLGIPEDDARQHETYVNQGKISASGFC